MDEKRATLEHIIAEHLKKRPNQLPIFEVMVFEKPSEEKIYPTGKHSGFPDLGCSDIVGFYHSFDDAVLAMRDNACDIRESVYNAGFVLCRFPGLYQACGSDLRVYFVWDENKQGFWEAKEPRLFRHVAY